MIYLRIWIICITFVVSKQGGATPSNRIENMNKLVMRVWEHSLKNPEGFTLSLETLKPVTVGYCVAYAETQNSFGLESLEAVINHALEHERIVGGWEDEGLYYFDSVRVFQDENEARAFAEANKQIGYYDLQEQETVFIIK